MARISEEAKVQKEEEKVCAKFKERYDLCKTHYSGLFKTMRLLDATDRGDMWKHLSKKFPKYQILPNTNFVAYVKSNLLASLYTVAKGASVQPTSEADQQLTTDINILLDHYWTTRDVGFYQFLAGERAALTNIGITQVGWSEDIIATTADTNRQGNVVLKNINPIKFMRDPFATSLETAGYCMTYDKYHKSVIAANPNYKERFKALMEKKEAFNQLFDTPELETNKKPNAYSAPEKAYFTVITYWEKTPEGTVDEYHLLEGKYILHSKKDIQPSRFPFAILYCNAPAEALIGVSEPYKILANNIAYNIMDSIALTSEYKNQNPPKFVSASSGLNLRDFIKHGDEADRTFVVNQDASRAVHYHQFPQISAALPNYKQQLQNNIEAITGVDGRYTGRDTGSIITTGGVEEMLNRVTLADTPKITLYERYTRELTELILLNMIEFSPKRSYFIKAPNSTKYKTITVDFPDLKKHKKTLFDYSIYISSELPNTKQRVANTANMLLETQQQYAQEGNSIELITPEEWLMFQQDLPNKEYMLERMGLQRQTNALEQTSQVLTEFSRLVEEGVEPNEAMLATANSLAAVQAGKPLDTAMPETAGPVVSEDMLM